jgi:hypothetical protein
LTGAVTVRSGDVAANVECFGAAAATPNTLVE